MNVIRAGNGSPAQQFFILTKAAFSFDFEAQLDPRHRQYDQPKRDSEQHLLKSEGGAAVNVRIIGIEHYSSVLFDNEIMLIGYFRIRELFRLRIKQCSAPFK